MTDLMSEQCAVCGTANGCTCRPCPKCKVSGDPKCYIGHIRTYGGVDRAYKRGFIAGRESAERASPYKSSRWVRFTTAWLRGYDRATQGKPLVDLNG